MAKRKKAQPWDAVFDRIRIVRDPEYVYPPLLTDIQLDEAETELGSQLPESYRAFMKRFGAGGLQSYAGLRAITTVGKGTVVGRTKELRKLYQSKYKRYFTNHEWLAGLVYFATCEGGHEYAWHPSEVTSATPHECQFYCLLRLREESPVAAGASFDTFVTWLDADIRSWRDRNPEVEPTPGITFHPCFLRRKKAPLNRDVSLWLASNNHTARDLALSIRDRGQTDAFPILADALQEAGCTNADLLDSCRTGDPDIDGKWVIQVLLGKVK